MKRFTLLMVILFIFYGCKKHTINNVNSIMILDDATVVIKKKNKRELICDRNQYSNKDNILIIMGDADAILYLPDLNDIQSIMVYGNGDLVIDEDEDELNFTNLAINITNNGKVDLKANGTTLTANVTNEGDLEIEGQVNSVYLSCSDEADYKAKNFIADNYYVQLSGSSDGYIYAKETIEGSVEDNADLYYKGNPTNINVSVSDNATFKPDTD